MGRRVGPPGGFIQTWRRCAGLDTWLQTGLHLLRCEPPDVHLVLSLMHECCKTGLIVAVLVQGLLVQALLMQGASHSLPCSSGALTSATCGCQTAVMP